MPTQTPPSTPTGRCVSIALWTGEVTYSRILGGNHRPYLGSYGIVGSRTFCLDREAGV